MKNPLCHLAQRRIESAPPTSGLLAKHVDSCPDCQNFFNEAQSLERRLHSAPEQSDEALCRDIMGQIRNISRQDSPKPTTSRSWMAGAGLMALVAIILVAMTFLKTDRSGEAESFAQTPPSQPQVEPTLDSAGNPTPSLASLVKQRELLERDARKLGAHLRERVILFQAVN